MRHLSVILCSLLAFLGLAVGLTAFAQDPIPYLGPGAEKLSPQEYERIYKNYIQTSILLGYPFLESRAAPCDHALNAIFRQVGMFGYPVPKEAQQVARAVRNVRKSKVETYEMAGVLVQVVRDGKSGVLDRLVLVNSSSPKASRRLSQLVKNDVLSLEKDPVTGLERVMGIPVGYPHPYLSAEGQGLFVKILEFNGKGEGCYPTAFFDNSWIGGFDLDKARCSELQVDVEQVWSEKLAPQAFAERELKRLKEKSYKHALARGVKPEEARALVEKHYTAPLTNEVNIVGSAMRSLAQCNLLALGRTGETRSQSGGEAPSAKGSSEGQSGSAQ